MKVISRPICVEAGSFNTNRKTAVLRNKPARYPKSRRRMLCGLGNPSIQACFSSFAGVLTLTPVPNVFLPSLVWCRSKEKAAG